MVSFSSLYFIETGIRALWTTLKNIDVHIDTTFSDIGKYLSDLFAQLQLTPDGLFLMILIDTRTEKIEGLEGEFFRHHGRRFH